MIRVRNEFFQILLVRHLKIARVNESSKDDRKQNQMNENSCRNHQHQMVGYYFTFELHFCSSFRRFTITITITFQFSIHYVNKTKPKINQISSTGFLDFFQNKQSFLHEGGHFDISYKYQPLDGILMFSILKILN